MYAGMGTFGGAAMPGLGSKCNQSILCERNGKWERKLGSTFYNRAVAKVPILNDMYFNATATELPTYMASQSDCMLHTNAPG